MREFCGDDYIGISVKINIDDDYIFRVDADLLVGSDGIWSKVRTQLDPSEAPQLPVWSGYTCFAAIAYTVPDDIADVGYKVYLGRRKYFVSVDVGGGRIQWYAAAAARNSARNRRAQL